MPPPAGQARGAAPLRRPSCWGHPLPAPCAPQAALLATPAGRAPAHLCQLRVRHDLIRQRALALLIGQPACRRRRRAAAGGLSSCTDATRPRCVAAAAAARCAAPCRAAAAATQHQPSGRPSRSSARGAGRTRVEVGGARHHRAQLEVLWEFGAVQLLVVRLGVQRAPAGGGAAGQPAAAAAASGAAAAARDCGAARAAG